MNDSDKLEGLLSVLEDIAETAAVYGDEQQRTKSRINYAKKFVRQLVDTKVDEALTEYINNTGA